MKTSAALKTAFPLLFTSFVNRVGTIGLSLVPALLVQRQISSDKSALIMALAKSALLVGTFLGGWVYDRVGTRMGVFFSFALAGIGLGFLPFQHDLVLLAVFALLAQLGQAMFPGLARIMLSELVAPGDQQEAVGWLRTSNNMGQIFSFGVGWLFLSGVMTLMLFDSATSILAILAGAALIPRHLTRPDHRARASSTNAESDVHSWLPLIVTLSMAISFNFFYELFMTGSAIKFAAAFGTNGVSYFARAMVLNTILCTALSVFASRHLSNPSLVLPAGLLMAAVSCWWGLSGETDVVRLMSATFLFTLGEIVFTAMSGFLLYRLIPQVSNRGAVFGGVLVLQNSGRILGAAAAFPFVSHVQVIQWLPLLALVPLFFAMSMKQPAAVE